MEIGVLAENTAVKKYRSVHGLSLYIKTSKHKILFDVGPDVTFLKNARRMGVDIADIDTVIISHGHYDHGRALKLLLKHNQKAEIYIRQNAFAPHYSAASLLKINIGLKKPVGCGNRIILVGKSLVIDDELQLFSDTQGTELLPSSNIYLLTKDENVFRPDDFSHEQNLIINQNEKTYLFAGCAHRGVVNIIESSKRYAGNPDYVIGGFHLFNPTSGKTESAQFLEQAAVRLGTFNAEYYTGHCTGTKAFEVLKKTLGNKLHYLHGGTSVTL